VTSPSRKLAHWPVTHASFSAQVPATNAPFTHRSAAPSVVQRLAPSVHAAGPGDAGFVSPESGIPGNAPSCDGGAVDAGAGDDSAPSPMPHPERL